MESLIQYQEQDVPLVLIESLNDVEINGLFKCPGYLIKFIEILPNR